jgi:hypothetical protein
MISCDLQNIVDESDNLYQVKKNEIHPGDKVILKTVNSVYNITVEKDGKYTVSGGWFDKQNLSPVKTSILGCTWGGSIIKTDIIAACGLHLEFANKLITSKIIKIFIFPQSLRN